MQNNFNSLSTVKFQEKMKPAALEIYKRIFGDCEIMDLRADGVKVHILDKHFAVDSLITFKSGQWISLQEKYRRFNAYEYCMNTQGFLDFTQEYKNALGTQHENDGEWFKLGAQMYFYGWANKEERCFVKWFLMDIVKYKLLVESAGGLSKLGKYKKNNKHGKASFFAIPVHKLKETFLYTYNDFK